MPSAGRPVSRALFAFALALACRESSGQSWVPVCSDQNLVVNNSVTRPGPTGNNPVVTFARGPCQVRVQACAVASCAGNVPTVTVEVVLSSPFDQIAGAFTEVGNTGSNPADDCNPNDGSTPHTTWGQSQRGHGGITVFGTPDRVIYGGCAAGLNFQTYTFAISPQNVPVTQRLRFEVHQSVPTEIVVLQLSGIRVRMSATTAPTTPSPTAPPTQHPDIVALNSQVASLMSTQAVISAAQNQVSTQTSFLAVNTASASNAVQISLSQLTAAQSSLTSGQSSLSSGQAAVSASVSQLAASQSQIRAAIVSAVSGVPTATAPPGGQLGPPQITADASTLRVQGNGLGVRLEADCGAIDPCTLLTALNQLRGV